MGRFGIAEIQHAACYRVVGRPATGDRPEVVLMATSDREVADQVAEGLSMHHEYRDVRVESDPGSKHWRGMGA